jgi:hypothetical protein
MSIHGNPATLNRQVGGSIPPASTIDSNKLIAKWWMLSLATVGDFGGTLQFPSPHSLSTVEIQGTMPDDAAKWYYRCKVCGKEHQIQAEKAPYWLGSQTLAGIPATETTLECPDNPGHTAQYSFTDYRQA